VAKEICEKISNKVANCVRATFPICKGFGKVGELTKKGAETIFFSIKRLSAKLGNLRKRVSAESRFASYDEKQKVVLSELGGEVFYGLEDNKKDLLGHEPVKDLLKEARQYETSKREIKEEINLQKRRMDELAIFRRATLDLESDDPRIRRVAIRVLKRLDNKNAIPYLMKCLEDPDPEVRKKAQEALHSSLNSIKNPGERKMEEIRILKKKELSSEPEKSQ